MGEKLAENNEIKARRYRVETASESIVIFDEVTSVRFDKELGTVAFFDAEETLVGLVPIGKLDNLALQTVEIEGGR